MKHQQKPEKSLMTCQSCKNNDCANCVDVPRAIYTDVRICTCQRQNHLGEATENQVADPFTEHIYGPNAVIKEDGTVTTDEEFKALWKEQFGDITPEN